MQSEGPLLAVMKPGRLRDPIGSRHPVENTPPRGIEACFIRAAQKDGGIEFDASRSWSGSRRGDHMPGGGGSEDGRGDAIVHEKTAAAGSHSQARPLCAAVRWPPLSIAITSRTLVSDPRVVEQVAAVPRMSPAGLPGRPTWGNKVLPGNKCFAEL